MVFSFQCPHCALEMEAGPELSNSTCTCPSCGGLFLVPDVAASAAETAVVQETFPAESELVSSGALESHAALFQELGDLRSRLEALEAERHRLESENLRLEAEVSRAEGEKTALSRHSSEQEEAKDLLEQRAALLEQEKAQLQDQKSALEKAREKDAAQFAALSDQLQAARERQSSAEGEAVRAQSVALESQEQIEQLRARLEEQTLALKSGEAVLATEREALKSSVRDLEGRLQKVQQKADAFEAEAEAARRQAQALQSASEGVSKTADSLSLELEKVRGELRTAQSEREALGQMLSAERARLEAEVRRVREESEHRVQSLGREVAEAAQKSRDLERLGAEKEDALKQRVLLEADLARERRKAEELGAALEQKLRDAQEESRSVQERLRTVEAESLNRQRDAQRALLDLESTRAELDAFRQAKETALRSAEGLKSEADNFSREMTALREQLTALQGERDALKADAVAVQKQLESAAVEMERLRNAPPDPEGSGVGDASGTKGSSKRSRTAEKLAVRAQEEQERLKGALAEAMKSLEEARTAGDALKAEKLSVEKGFAQEHERLCGALANAEKLRTEAQEDGRRQADSARELLAELERTRLQAQQVLAEKNTMQSSLSADRTAMEQRLRALEADRDAALQKERAATARVGELHGELEKALQRSSEEAGRVRVEKENVRPEAVEELDQARRTVLELQQTLLGRDTEIKRLAAQVRHQILSEAEEGKEQSPGSLFLRKWGLPAGGGVGVLVGILLGGLMFPKKQAPVSVSLSPVDRSSKSGESAAAKPTESASSDGSSGTRPTSPPQGSESGSPTKDPAPPAVAAVQSAPTLQVEGGSVTASRAGMPARLPEQFLGIRFGTALSEVSGISQWRETAGKKHRKAELLGAEVEAVLTSDSDGRLVMGSYVRVAARQQEALVPFLEWVVNVQDAVSALYGEPTRIHQVDGATEAIDVVRKIASGEDFYQATWERDAEECLIDLSIRVFNERSVVFRMEYRHRPLYTALMEKLEAKEEAPEKAPKAPEKEEREDPAPR